MNLTKQDDVTIDIRVESDAGGISFLSFYVKNQCIDSIDDQKWQKFKHYIFVGSNNIDSNHKLRVTVN